MSYPVLPTTLPQRATLLAGRDVDTMEKGGWNS